MNNYNMTPANFKEEVEKLFLHDPALYIKFLGISDPNWYPFGFLEMEKTLIVKLEHAAFKTGIPARLVHKAVIDQEIAYEGKLKQWSPETLALLSQRYIDSRTTGKRRVVYGQEVPPPVFFSLDMVTQTVDGKEFRIRIRKGQMTSEDFQAMLGGKEHAVLPFRVEALVDTDPIGNNPDWDYLGKEGVAGTLASSSTTITGVSFGSLENLKVGGHIMGANIPEGTTIVSVDYTGNEIEISAAATGEATDQAITVEVNDSKAKYDNIAFFEFMEPAA